jgi:flagellar biosynthesis/type III secretory pathway protein FliH
VVILELPKLTEKEDEAVWPWLKFFKCKEQEEFEMLAKKHPELKEAVSCVKHMSFGEQWRWEMLKRQVRKMDEREEKRQLQLDKEQHKLDIEEARAKAMAEGLAEGLAEGMEKGLAKGIEEGLAEGEAKGITEEKLEIARKMKAIGRPEPEIAEITGLPLETIQGL